MTCTCCQKPAKRWSKLVDKPADNTLRDILALAAKPEIISFAGGLPAAAGFPIDAIGKATLEVLAERGPAALQYSGVVGEQIFREEIAHRETDKGVPTTADQVQIISSSQQGLDIMARIFIDKGDKVLVESPTYLGALQAFALCEPTFVELPCDENGINPAAFGEECRGAKFAYVMPTAANPSGITIDEDRRKLLCEKAREYDMWLFEDDPYGELWYDEAPPPSLRKWAPERTIRMGTMSKVLSPGFRLGYFIAPPEVLEKIAGIKAAMDLCTSAFTQSIAGQCLKDGLFATHIPSVRARYATHAKAMLAALDEFMPEGVTWSRPVGGMFIWVTLPEHIDATQMLLECIEQNVAYVPGEPFFANNPPKNHFRLAFVTVDPETIREGVRRIAEIIRTKL